MNKYQIWYEPRMDDPIPMWDFQTLEQAKEQMEQVKQTNPQAYPYHYIWDIENKVKVENNSNQIEEKG
mgnify:FL=1|tara:strand:- start:274 stop:477 length:204 start_codon:yes stop_codon:yes gene_type:complete